MTTEKAIPTKQTKAEIVSTIAETSKLTKAQVKAVLEALASCARCHLKKGGSGEFVVPELAVKLRRVEKPATTARKGHNPLTGEEIMIKAKPARKVIRALPLKALKDVLS
jgi:nucleoid DNA-binding protein